jgi:hypothetical protein
MVREQKTNIAHYLTGAKNEVLAITPLRIVTFVT